MPGLLDFLQSPGVAAAAGLLQPTLNSRTGPALLQGLQAANVQGLSNNRTQAGSLLNQQTQRVNQARQGMQDFTPESLLSLFQAGDTQGINAASGLLNATAPTSGRNITTPELARIATDPNETPERRAAASAALKEIPSRENVVNVNTSGQNPFNRKVAEKLGEQFVEQRDIATSARDQIISANHAISFLDSDDGIISGKFADFRLGFSKMARLAGFDTGSEVQNTESFAAAMGNQVLGILGSGALGAGTGISDNDRMFAKQIAGGEITLDEKSMRRILNMNAKVAGNVIDRFNKRADKVPETLFPGSQGFLKVERPAFAGGRSDAPEGVAPAVWDVMTPEEKALWD
jgi:hypothetical protein